MHIIVNILIKYFLMCKNIVKWLNVGKKSNILFWSPAKFLIATLEISSFGDEIILIYSSWWFSCDIVDLKLHGERIFV